MMRRKALVVAAVTAVALGIAVALFSSRDSDKSNSDAPKQEAIFNGTVAEYQGTEYCEIIVDLGTVRRSATVEETIRLTNNSDAPIVLLDYSTQCRCMWLEFKREPIAPNESTDITLTFDSRGEWGSVGNYMEIATSCDSAPIILWIGAEIE